MYNEKIRAELIILKRIESKLSGEHKIGILSLRKTDITLNMLISGIRKRKYKKFIFI